MLKNLENNGSEEIGLVTPTPGQGPISQRLYLLIIEIPFALMVILVIQSEHKFAHDRQLSCNGMCNILTSGLIIFSCDQAA